MQWTESSNKGRFDLTLDESETLQSGLSEFWNRILDAFEAAPPEVLILYLYPYAWREPGTDGKIDGALYMKYEKQREPDRKPEVFEKRHGPLYRFKSRLIGRDYPNDVDGVTWDEEYQELDAEGTLELAKTIEESANWDSIRSRLQMIASSRSMDVIIKPTRLAPIPIKIPISQEK
jgi:hypothetical protein